jgi:hypothetical protein
VTYAFCKEFISLLLENVGAGGELPTIDVLVKLFQKVCYGIFVTAPIQITLYWYLMLCASYMN